MQLWKMDSLGVTSEDFINRDSQNAPNAFYGSMWKFKNDRTGTAVNPNQQATNPAYAPQPGTDDKLTPKGFLQQSVQTELSKSQRHRQAPLDNHLVDEARAQGQPVSEADTGYTDEHREAQEHGEAVLAGNSAIINQGESKFTEQQLNGMSKDQLSDIAAALGVVNLDQPKKKLTEAILAKQG